MFALERIDALYADGFDELTETVVFAAVMVANSLEFDLEMQMLFVVVVVAVAVQ